MAPSYFHRRSWSRYCLLVGPLCVALLIFAFSGPLEHGRLNTWMDEPLNRPPTQSKNLSCADQRRLLPHCVDCIPGLVGPHCELSKGALDLRTKIRDLVSTRYPNASSPYDLYPYLNTDDLRSRQAAIGTWLSHDNRKSILNIGTNYSPLHRHFPQGFCPETLLMIEPVGELAQEHGSENPWLSRYIHCPEGGHTHVIIAPTSISGYLESKHAKSVTFDAVVCVGCDKNWGNKLSLNNNR